MSCSATAPGAAAPRACTTGESSEVTLAEARADWSGAGGHRRRGLLADHHAQRPGGRGSAAIGRRAQGRRAERPRRPGSGPARSTPRRRARRSSPARGRPGRGRPPGPPAGVRCVVGPGWLARPAGTITAAATTPTPSTGTATLAASCGPAGQAHRSSPFGRRTGSASRRHQQHQGQLGPAASGSPPGRRRRTTRCPPCAGSRYACRQPAAAGRRAHARSRTPSARRAAGRTAPRTARASRPALPAGIGGVDRRVRARTSAPPPAVCRPPRPAARGRSSPGRPSPPGTAGRRPSDRSGPARRWRPGVR